MSDSENQFNFDKRRRSSILKPAKMFDNRAPLQELGACSDDTTTTTSSIYRKRVSFHVVNIKEFSTHAQTQEVQKNPAYDELISSMSDSSRNNTKSECSNFSPMVPAYVVPQDDDKENQINNVNDSDSVDEDTSDLYEEDLPPQYNEPFDLSTRSKHEEPRNFLESTKLSHCNTIMTTFNISGINNLDDTNMQDLGEMSEDDSLQHTMEQQLNQDPMRNVFQYQQESIGKENVNLSLGGERNNMVDSKSLSVHHVAEHSNSENSGIELTCHIPTLATPEALDESEMEMTTAIPRRKSFAPRKSVNFKNRQNDSFDRSDEMEFTSAFPAMSHAAQINKSNLDESEMEETGVLPRKSLRPCQSVEMNSVMSECMENYTTSVPVQYTEMYSTESPNKTDAKFEPMVPKSRKSIGGNIFKNRNLENSDECGMEMTRAFDTLPPNTREEYDVSLSESISDMDITNQSPPNISNISHSMMVVNKTSIGDSSSVDFTIKTSFPENMNRIPVGANSMVDQNGCQLQSNKNIFAKSESSNLDTMLHKSFPGFEKTALNIRSTGHRNSAPYLMASHHDVPAQKMMMDDSETEENNSKMNISSVSGIRAATSFAIQSLISEEHEKSHTSIGFIEPSNLPSNSSVPEQTCLTTDLISISSLHPVPVAHSTNLNMSLEQKKSSIETTCQESSVTGDKINSISKSTSGESVNISSHEDSMEMSRAVAPSCESAFHEIQTSVMDISTALETGNSKRIQHKEAVLVQKQSDADVSLVQTGVRVEKSIASEDMPVPVGNTSLQTSEVLKESNLSALESVCNVPDTNHADSDSLAMSFITTDSQDTSLVKEVLHSQNTSKYIDNNADLPSDNTKKPELVPDVNYADPDSAVMFSSAADSHDNSLVQEVLVSQNMSKYVDSDAIFSSDNTKKPELEMSLRGKPESPKMLQVSTDDGFSSNQTIHQSMESGVSLLQSAQISASGVLDISKMSCDLVEVERSRKRPSDGFEPHDENFVETGNGNNVVAANPKKRSKTFEHGASASIVETNEVTTCPNENNKATVPTIKTAVIDTSFAIITPNKPANIVTPMTTPTPSKTCAFATPGNPVFVTPGKHVTAPTPDRNRCFVTPSKSSVEGDGNNTQDSHNISDLSTYVNPSSTLTDSVINNITIKMDTLIGSTRKPSASEVKAKQMVSCSTPLLPNSCSKNMIVDRFFQSIDNRGKQSDSFVVPSKSIIKKLNMNSDESKQDSPDVSSPREPSGSCDNTPGNSSAESNMTLKRTKEQLNISEHNDLNSSNYIPEKQQKNASNLDSVVNDISLLDISEDSDRLDHVQKVLATTLNISDVRDKSTSESDLSNKNKSLGVVSETEFTDFVSLPDNMEVRTTEQTKETDDKAKENNVADLDKKSEEILTEKQILDKRTSPETEMARPHLDEIKLTGSKKKIHEEPNQSPAKRVNIMKKRKSRLSIVQKVSPVEKVAPRADVKRKTLKIQAKRSIMMESGDESMEEEEHDHAEQNILAEEQRGNVEWKLKTLEPNLWEFEFFYDLIVLRVEFNSSRKKSIKEKSVKTISFQTGDQSTEIRALCFKLLHNKYSKLRTMCSSSSDVIPLLQHISPYMSYLKRFAQSLRYCELTYGMKLSETEATVEITSYSNLEWSKVTLDIKDVDFITTNDIHVVKMFGTLSGSDVRQQFPVLSTRDNPAFIKTFIENIYKLINSK